ncbi:MAG: LysR family transcriptional regulator [Chloroflexota bacterium]
MELYQLQTFVIVAEEGNVTRAAKRLYTTPSTISMHIKALEEELGVQLFTRSNQGMAITPKGQQILDKARLTLHAAQNLVNHASDIQTKLVGQVSIGLCSAPPYLKIPQLIQQLRKNHPSVGLLLDQSTTIQISEAIVANRLDLGFVYGAVTNPLLEANHLTQTELVVVVPAIWPTDFDPGNWHDLATRPWVSSCISCPFQQVVDDYLVQHGLTCQHRVEIDDERGRYELVKAGLGLSLLDRYGAEQGVAEGTVRIAPVDPIPVDLLLVYRAHERNQPLLRYVTDLITALFDAEKDISLPSKNGRKA